MELHTYTVQNLPIVVKYNYPMMVAVRKEQTIPFFISRDTACRERMTNLRKNQSVELIEGNDVNLSCMHSTGIHKNILHG